MSLIAETDRLKIRIFEMDDVEPMLRIFGDVEVMHFGDGIQTRDWVQNFLRESINGIEQFPGAAPWAVDLKNQFETIGYCGLFYFSDINGRAELEIGYRIARDYWGQGYATEAAAAVRDYVFKTLKHPRLIALIDPENISSINVAKKIGFRFEADVTSGIYPYSDHIYVNSLSE